MQHSINRYADIYSTARSCKAPKQAEQFHKLKLGARVTLIHASRDPRSKEQRLKILDADFEITGLLPAEGRRFQYRIKDLATGHERVVLEDQIANPVVGLNPGPPSATQSQ